MIKPGFTISGRRHRHRWGAGAAWSCRRGGTCWPRSPAGTTARGRWRARRWAARSPCPGSRPGRRRRTWCAPTARSAWSSGRGLEEGQRFIGGWGCGSFDSHGSCSRLFRGEEDMHFQTELISEANVMMGLGLGWGAQSGYRKLAIDRPGGRQFSATHNFWTTHLITMI